jgi:hypothetical protein
MMRKEKEKGERTRKENKTNKRRKKYTMNE